MKFQDFVCGLMAGWSQIICGQPFDYVKVKVQVQSQASSKSLLDIAREIQKQHGFLGFYRGASSLFFGFAFTIGLQFTIYQFSKRMINDFRLRKQQTKQEYSDSSLGISDVGIAGGIVGLCVSLIYCPVQYVKIKRQLQNQVSNGSLSLLFDQIKNNGIKNITKGLTATILRQVIGSCVYYAVYEYCVRTLSRQQRSDASTLNYIMSGSMAGLSYWVVSYPMDVIKTKVQNGQSYKAAFQQLAKSSYRGFSAVFVRSILVNGASFATYQHSKKLFLLFQSKQSQL